MRPEDIITGRYKFADGTTATIVVNGLYCTLTQGPEDHDGVPVWSGSGTDCLLLSTIAKKIVEPVRREHLTDAIGAVRSSGSAARQAIVEAVVEAARQSPDADLGALADGAIREAFGIGANDYISGDDVAAFVFGIDREDQGAQYADDEIVVTVTEEARERIAAVSSMSL